MRKTMISASLLTMLMTNSALAGSKQSSMITSGINVNLTAEQISTTCDDVLAQAHQQFTQLENQQGEASLKRVVGSFEDIIDGMAPIGHVWYFKAVHPSDEVRDAAD